MHLLSGVALHLGLVAVLVLEVAEVALPLSFLKLLLSPPKQHHNGNRNDQYEDDDDAGQYVGEDLRGADGGQVQAAWRRRRPLAIHQAVHLDVLFAQNVVLVTAEGQRGADDELVLYRAVHLTVQQFDRRAVRFLWLWTFDGQCRYPVSVDRTLGRGRTLAVHASTPMADLLALLVAVLVRLYDHLLDQLLRHLAVVRHTGRIGAGPVTVPFALSIGALVVQMVADFALEVRR